MEQERKELLNNESEDRAKNKTGLVLEGGGMRGIYTAGVLDVFLDEGLEFDGVIGVSAGAVHGCSFLSGQRGRSIRYYKKYCADKRFMSAENMIRTGNFVDTDFCYHELPEVLDPYDYEAFDRNKEKTDFYVVCSDVEKGTPVYAKLHDMKKDIDYIRASASLPYVSKFVELGGRKLLDGGCTDSVPVEAFMKLGFTKDVVVLTRDLEYRKKPENAWMADLVYRKYPKFAEVLKNRSVEYNRSIRRIEKLEKEGMQAILLDLRQNPGGLLDESVKVANYLVPKGPVVSITNKNNKTQVLTSQLEKVKYPLAVLVDHGSASASEILAGAVQDTKAGKLFGVKTYGKGVVQTIYHITPVTGLKLTTAKYYTPSGRSIDKVGIEPDVEIALPEQATEDVQLKKAESYLQEELAKTK